jgi:hypothetical protein
MLQRDASRADAPRPRGRAAPNQEARKREPKPPADAPRDTRPGAAAAPTGGRARAGHRAPCPGEPPTFVELGGERSRDPSPERARRAPTERARRAAVFSAQSAANRAARSPARAYAANAARSGIPPRARPRTPRGRPNTSHQKASRRGRRSGAVRLAGGVRSSLVPRLAREHSVSPQHECPHFENGSAPKPWARFKTLVLSVTTRVHTRAPAAETRLAVAASGVPRLWLGFPQRPARRAALHDAPANVRFRAESSVIRADARTVPFAARRGMEPTNAAHRASMPRSVRAFVSPFAPLHGRVFPPQIIPQKPLWRHGMER